MNRSGMIVVVLIAIAAIGIPTYFHFRSDPATPVSTAKTAKVKKVKKVKVAMTVQVDTCLLLRMDKADQCCQDLISAAGRRTCNRHLDRMISAALIK